jgi:hypothetical protein
MEISFAGSQSAKNAGMPGREQTARAEMRADRGKAGNPAAGMIRRGCPGLIKFLNGRASV